MGCPILALFAKGGKLRHAQVPALSILAILATMAISSVQYRYFKNLRIVWRGLQRARKSDCFPIRADSRAFVAKKVSLTMPRTLRIDGVHCYQRNAASFVSLPSVNVIRATP